MRELGLNVAFYVDPLSIFFALITSFFGSMAILYSVKDMTGEKADTRYYTLMLLFLGSMIWLVLAGNLILLFILWEVVGLSSYGLIGFYMSKPESSKASFKALFITHILGICLLLGGIIIHHFTGSYDLPVISESIHSMADTRWVQGILILFLLASMAKSVQIPFHTWLPSATVAPSPVTAFLHAAAMVKAGVYLMARSFFLFTNYEAGTFLIFMAAIGAITLTFCTLIAWMQVDVKKVLAYHTAGQIGYMFLGLGAGTALGMIGGLFHCLTHAVFKGLLFLCAGSLIYATGRRNLDEMGGLYRKMPYTAAAMVIGAISIIGVPPFSGFASKLIIYEASISQGMTIGGGLGGLYTFFGVLAIFTSAITMASFMKVIHSAFFGGIPSKLENTVEVPWSMRIPLIVLSALCVAFGVYPQAPLTYLINPAVSVITGQSTVNLNLMVTSFGYQTVIGMYPATSITAMILIFLSIGAVIYAVSSKRWPSTKIPGKQVLFTGGELSSPYIDIDKVRVNSRPFVYAFEQVFGGFYRFVKKGELDSFYYSLSYHVQRSSFLFSSIATSKIGFSVVLVFLMVAVIFSPIMTGIILILYGSFIALTQTRLKRLLLFASISYLGYVIYEFGVNVNNVVAGTLPHLFNFLIFGSLLFLTSIAVLKASKTDNIESLGGLSSRMPITAFAFLIGGLAFTGIPPFNGWWNEFWTMENIVKTGGWGMLIVVFLAAAFSLTYMLKAFHKIFLGELPPSCRDVRRVSNSLLLPIILLSVFSILIGIYPKIIITFVEGISLSLG
ncbi:MAG: hypothetical protein L6N94_00260 [Candidatus Methylarchaceae archaeon HK01M]|nr:hypothetical protein [Candidatus Methylarchaceae archaeon HK01M]